MSPTLFEQAIAGKLPASFARAAAFERDRRDAAYPDLVTSGQLSLHDATVDYQCWCVLTHWLETGTFRSIDGGPDGNTVVSWPECVIATDKALAVLDRMIAKREGDPKVTPEERAELPELQRRRAGLVAIGQLVHRMRTSIDTINAEIRAAALEPARVAA